MWINTQQGLLVFNMSRKRKAPASASPLLRILLYRPSAGIGEIRNNGDALYVTDTTQKLYYTNVNPKKK